MGDHLTAISIAAFSVWGLVFVVLPLLTYVADRHRLRR
jgi:hypothetical protein